MIFISKKTSWSIMNNNNIKETIESLREKQGSNTELISLYIPPDKPISDIIKYLRNEVAQSQNIKSKRTRNNVLENISSIMGQLAKI